MPKKSQSSPFSRNITLFVTVAVLALAAIFTFTGNDYLGLFTTSTPNPPADAATALPAGDDGAYDDASVGGNWWTVYFTDPAVINDPDNLSGSIPEKLIEMIDGAQQSIHIAAFEFNLTPVAEALIEAHERGVEVQWMTDDEHGIDADEDEGHGQFAMLEDADIDVRDDARSALMHNKFIIFDGQTVWTGSTNLTRNGNFRNNNNVIIIRSAKVAEMFEREFAEMWAGEHGPKSPSTVDLQSTRLDGTPIQVFFAAEDDVISHLMPMVQGAQHSVRFMAFSFTHDGLGEAMLQLADDGVDVQGIFEKRGSETEYSEMPRLFCAGVPVRQDGNPGTFHHKVIIIDDETVITGSLNFSENADESNDENVLVIRNADIARLYLQEFNRRWNEAAPPDPSAMGCK